MKYITNVGWVTIYENGVFHILPYNDSKLHIDTVGCKCKPDLTFNSNGTPVLYHPPFDGRDLYEGAESFCGITGNNYTEH